MNPSKLRVFIQNFFSQVLSEFFDFVLWLVFSFDWLVPIRKWHTIIIFWFFLLLWLSRSVWGLRSSFIFFVFCVLLLLVFNFLHSIFDQGYCLSNFHVFHKFFIVELICKFDQILNLFIFILVDLFFCLCPDWLWLFRCWKSLGLFFLFFLLQFLNDLVHVLLILQIIILIICSSCYFFVLLLHSCSKFCFFQLLLLKLIEMLVSILLLPLLQTLQK